MKAIEAVAWALCPHLEFMLHGERRECRRCPASSYYPEVDARGTQFCRHIADKAAHDVLAALLRPEVLEALCREANRATGGRIGIGSDEVSDYGVGPKTATRIVSAVLGAALREGGSR